jgi:RHS repeat-associated protein
MNPGALTFTYDGDGNRVAKTVGFATTKFLVDDLNPTGYAQVIEEVTGSSVQRTYTYGNSLVSQKQVGSNQSSFYGSDAIGSVRLLTNSAGTVTDTYNYEAFGNLISATGTTTNNYGYSGERFDSDLGAYHLRERYYSPQRGRFLTTDPFAGFIDRPQTLHKYNYVHGDPVNYTDPSGLTETLEHHLNVVRLQIQTKLPCIRAIASITIPNAGGVIRSFVSTKPEIYYRVFSGTNRVGPYLFKVIPKSRALARLGASLPPWNQADFIQEVLVPAGTRLQRSRALPVPEWGGCGGLEQFLLLTDIADEAFGAGIPFL